MFAFIHVRSTQLLLLQNMDSLLGLQLTKHRRKAGIPDSILYLLSFALSHSLLQPPWSQRRTGIINNLTGLKLPVRSSRDLQDSPPLQMRIITCNDETAPWGSSHFMGNRLLTSSEDSHNIFSRTPLGTLGLR
jgi:hypothetical protein